MDYAEHLHRDHQPEHLHHLHHLRQTDSPRTAENSPKCSRTSNRSLSHRLGERPPEATRGQNNGINRSLIYIDGLGRTQTQISNRNHDLQENGKTDKSRTNGAGERRKQTKNALAGSLPPKSALNTLESMYFCLKNSILCQYSTA